MISVIIPIYNVEKYLRECLDSVVGQDFVDKEVILVDDGSKDSSGAICDEYASLYPFIKAIHKKNGGLSSARNAGIDAAKGEWVVFLDSDDLWSDSGTLSKLKAYAESLNLDILRFEYLAVNERLQPLEQKEYNKISVKNRILSNYELVKDGIAGEWFAWLYLIRKELLKDIRFDENCRFQEDIDFYCKLFARKDMRCGYIGEKLYLYRKRENSITTTYKIDNLRGSFNLCGIFHAESGNCVDVNLSALYRYYSVMMYYWTLGTLSEKPYYANRKKIISDLSLVELQKRTNERMRNCRIDRKYYPFILFSPFWGTCLLHIKNAIVAAINRL